MLMKSVIALACLLLTAAPAFAQTSPCKFLCEPTFLVEPTITFEKDATVFETVFALDMSTPMPRVGVTLEAITKPFRDENDVEIAQPQLAGIESDWRMVILAFRHHRQVQRRGARADTRA